MTSEDGSVSEAVYPLAPDGVFWTIQGEGLMRGVPMAFVRLAGCSVGCPECDTDYRVAERVTATEIRRRVVDVMPSHGTGQSKWVWITGGEPTDHNLGPLISGLRGIQLAVALATSGVRYVNGLDVSFLSVSPHAPDFVQTSGDELKVVPGLNGFALTVLDGRRDLRFGAKFVQPLWWQTVNGPEMDGTMTRASIRACCDWVLTHPDWRMTDQGHKAWGLP